MPTERFRDIPADALTVIEARTGPAVMWEPASAGMNSEIAGRLHTPVGPVFLKGLRQEHPRIWTQQREADINPHVRQVAPALLWRAEEAGWDILAFEDIDGRHADYRAGSPDLPLIVDAMTALAAIEAPDITLRTMPSRMTSHTPEPGLFEGTALLHTDWFPTNVLISDGRAVLVDWAWASRGAPWIDAALWTVWLIRHGHTPAQAEAWAACTPVWADAPAESVTAFAHATASVWRDIADGQDEQWINAMLDAANTWAAAR